MRCRIQSVRMRRLAPVFALFFLSPLVAEFFLGDFPVVLLFLIIVFAPMYGGGALLIRELARRTGRGWPTMVLLALAFGVLQEGLLTESLFNKDYARSPGQPRDLRSRRAGDSLVRPTSGGAPRASRGRDPDHRCCRARVKLGDKKAP
jgi:hypothetical protein